MSFSKYPIAIDDVVSLPVTQDLVTPVQAEVVNRLRDAIIAVESELGVQPSGTFGSVRARLDALRAEIESIKIELGPNPSGTFDTVVERLNDIDARIAALQSQVQIVLPILSGTQETNSSTLVSKGATIINPTSLGYPNVTFTSEVIFQTTNSSYAITFELFNVTEGVVISHPVCTTTNTNATFKSINLTIGGADFPANQDNIIEGRISLASGAPAIDRAVIKHAAIRVTPT